MKSERKVDNHQSESFNPARLLPSNWLGIEDAASALGFNVFSLLEFAAVLFFLENSIQRFGTGYLIPGPYRLPSNLLLVSIYPVLIGCIVSGIASLTAETDRNVTTRRHHHLFRSTESSTADPLRLLPSRLLGIQDTRKAVGVNLFALLESVALYYALTTPMEHLNMGLYIANPGQIPMLALGGTICAALVGFLASQLSFHFKLPNEDTTPRLTRR